MIILEGGNPPLHELVHFGIKGMRWGRRKKFSGISAPRTPREATKNSSREEQLISRVTNQGYVRVVGPPMARYVRDIPNYKQSSDPKVNALLSRTLTQGVNRVEEEAGRAYMLNLPGQ